MEVKACLLNAAYGGWYARGQARLRKSLNYTGFARDEVYFTDEIINEYHNPEFPYSIKAAAFSEAMRRGYEVIMWADCSCFAIGDINPIFDRIIHEGSLFVNSGYNLAQTATDKDLQFAVWTRDEAEKMPELASGIFGVDLRTERGFTFADWFLRAAREGVFNSSREHAGQSEDPRFIFGRQDQTAATIAFYKAGYEKITPFGDFASYYADRKKNKEAVILLRGL